MSGTPPFCTLGSKYYHQDFSSSLPLYEDAVASISTFNYPGWHVEFVGTAQIFNESIKILMNIDTNLPHTVKFRLYYNCNYPAALFLGMTDVMGYNKNFSILIQPNDTGGLYIQIEKKDGSDYIISLTGYISWPYDFEIQFEDTLNVLINGVNVGSTSNNTSTGISLTYLYMNIRRQAEPVSFTGGMTLSDLYIIGSDMPNPCQGEIPTYHRVAPASTVKLAHYRRIAEYRDPTKAETFHNQIKGTI